MAKVLGDRILLRPIHPWLQDEGEMENLGGYLVDGPRKGEGWWAFPPYFHPRLKHHPILGKTVAHLTPPLPRPDPAVLSLLLPEQREDLERVLEGYVCRRGFLLANGTGTGKTYVYAAFARTVEGVGCGR